MAKNAKTTVGNPVNDEARMSREEFYAARDAQQHFVQREQDWVPPSQLPDPVLHDESTVYRWVRYELNGAQDNKNVSYRSREGWTPVAPEEQPEVAAVADPTNDGTIKIGGLMLCKMPTELAKARDRFFQKKTKDQQQAVDENVMRDSNPRMPMQRPYRDSRVEFGRGKQL